LYEYYSAKSAPNGAVVKGWQLPPHSFPVTFYTPLAFGEHLPSVMLQEAIPPRSNTRLIAGVSVQP
jgi:hypothetical protein